MSEENKKYVFLSYTINLSNLVQPFYSYPYEKKSF